MFYPTLMIDMNAINLDQQQQKNTDFHPIEMSIIPYASYHC